uniref:Immunoglobulin domain-containing protein n=1 Tax=Ursus maritimus TaxID=29073 RepID=A0A452U2I1_URSMA
MAGSARTPTLTALLCLGTLPKPSIWADPGHIVTQGRPVTIWCQASLRADGYYLYKERVSEPFWETSPDSSNKTIFPFASMSSHTAGRYQCAYHSRNIWSQRSDFLPLVVTGAYGAPSLSANPGPVVALGGTVSLSCSSQEAWQSFRLLKEGGADAPQQLEFTSHPETYHALFLVGPVNTSHAGTYRCYASPQSYPHSWSQPSDPLHLQVTGEGAPSPSPPTSWAQMTDLSHMPSGDQDHPLWHGLFWGDHRAPGILSLGQWQVGWSWQRERVAPSKGRSTLKWGACSPCPSPPCPVPGGSEDAPLLWQKGKGGLCREVVGGRSSA